MVWKRTIIKQNKSHTEKVLPFKLVELEKRSNEQKYEPCVGTQCPYVKTPTARLVFTLN